MFEPRPYQANAITATLDYLSKNASPANPLIVLPTGAGKSVVQAELVSRVLSQWPSTRFLLLTHVKELVEQNAAKLTALLGKKTVGVYCAGLRKKQVGRAVTCASIQSVERAVRKGDVRADIVIIDEAHLVPHDGEGRYRKVLEELRSENEFLRVIGMTATPYRTGSGMLTEGDGAIFTEVVIDVPIPELIKDGYLSPLTSKAGSEYNLDGVRTRMGDFVSSDLQDAAADAATIRAQVDEWQALASSRTASLFFCTGVAHAKAVNAEIQGRGYRTEVILGNTDRGKRATCIKSFREGRLEALVSVGVLTTGFDAPNVDCVALMRPTKSPGLYYQMVGRGFRVAPGKTDCLVLDFGGNVRRHGALDDLEGIPTGKRKKDGPSFAPRKTCEKCKSFSPIAATECGDCGAPFPEREGPKVSRKADTTRILSGGAPKLRDVGRVNVSVHVGSSGVPCVRVDYRTAGNLGTKIASDFICVEHTGFARQKAERSWRALTDAPCPHEATAAAALLRETLREVSAIEIKKDGRYTRVVRVIGEEKAA